MAQQFLHAAQVGPAVQEVGGEGVPEHMRADPAAQRRPADAAIEDHAHPPVGERPAPPVEEEDRGVASSSERGPSVAQG